MDDENPQPNFCIQIPHSNSSLWTPIHPLNPFISSTTGRKGDETDSYVFSTDDVENTTFDVDDNDDQEKLFLDDSVMVEKDVDENSVNFFLSFLHAFIFCQ